MLWKKIDLELSLKSFPYKEQEKIEEVIHNLFRQWNKVIQESEKITVMLWIADGSEILEYSGDINKEFEWAKWIGVANPPKQEKPLSEAEKRPYLCPREYRENPRTFTYQELKNIVLTLKRIFF